MNFDDLHELYKDNYYSWLPSKEEIPKTLGEPTPADHLESLEVIILPHLPCDLTPLVAKGNKKRF